MMPAGCLYRTFTIRDHDSVNKRVERDLHFDPILQMDFAAERVMKIYLLIVLMVALWTAIRMTSTQNGASKPVSR